MADNLGPADAVAGLPEYSAREWRQLNSVKYAGATAARPLGSRSGVRPGTPATTVTATSATWTCQPFGGSADVMTATEAGTYDYAFDAVATGSMEPAHATLTRKDILYVSVTDPAEGIGATPTVTRKYLAGAAGSGTAPTVPIGERGYVIAELNVPISGGGSPSVTWVAPYLAAAGGTVWFNTKAELDLWAAEDGHSAFVISEDVEYLRAGSLWRPKRPLNTRFVRSTAADAFINTVARIGLVSGTITDAPAGLYRVAGRASLFSNGTVSSGSVYVSWASGGAAAAYEDARLDIPNVGTLSPVSPYVERTIVHPGGNLDIGLGYKLNSGACTVTGQSSGLTVVEATYLGPGV